MLAALFLLTILLFKSLVVSLPVCKYSRSGCYSVQSHNCNANPSSPQDRMVQKSISFISNSLLLTTSILSIPTASKTVAATIIDNTDEPKQQKGFQTKSGLKFFDILPGINGTRPKYGQLVSFHYTSYFRPLGNGELDSSYLAKEPFLYKHGNTRVIRGIDEAIHTMNVGGRRRIIVPNSLGYTEVGLGPVPSEYFSRQKLGRLIDKFEANEGELVIDVDLVMVADDENDQGYYTDDSVSDEELKDLIRINTIIKKQNGQSDDDD